MTSALTKLYQAILSIMLFIVMYTMPINFICHVMLGAVKCFCFMILIDWMQFLGKFKW